MRVFIAIGSLSLLVSCGSERQPETEQQETPASQPAPRFDLAKLEAAKLEIAKEPKVRDFVLDPDNAVMLQIAVDDDGTRRYGLAGYFCQRLREWQLYDDKSVVRIVDAAKVELSQGDFRSISLGTVRCKDESRWD